MSTKIVVFIVHGIGINKSGFADDLIKAVKTAFNNLLTQELKVHTDYTNDLDFREIAWDEKMDSRQKELSEKIRQNMNKFAQPVNGKWYEKLLVFFVRLFNGWLRGDFAAQFIVDIISYGDQSTRQLIFKCIDAELEKINLTNPSPSVTFISHSLGTVIAADFIREKQLDSKQNFDIANFFTMGSPIQLFSLQYGEEMYKMPIAFKNPNGRWINILDTDDPVAYRLKELNEGYGKVVLKDVEVETGFFGHAHLGYWVNPDVHTIIAHKLALDWLKQNNKISDEDFQKRIASYDNNLGLID